MMLFPRSVPISPGPGMTMAMLRGQSFLLVITIASLAAGPLACIRFAVVMATEGHNVLVGMDLENLLFLGPGICLIASIVAILPVAFGTAALALLGARFAWARSMLAWGAAGALPAGLFAIWVASQPGRASIAIFTFVGTGIGCALVSRSCIRWAEPASQA